MSKTKEVKEVVDVVDTETSKKEVQEFDYLAISKEDFEVFTKGIESLNEPLQVFLGNLLMGKFRLIPKSVTTPPDSDEKTEE